MRESNLEAAWLHCGISFAGRENVGTEEGQHEESLTATATVLVFQESTVKRAFAGSSGRPEGNVGLRFSCS